MEGKKKIVEGKRKGESAFRFGPASGLIISKAI